MRLDAKCFKNKICQACIEKNTKKYGSFQCKCDGITVEEDVAFAVKNGETEHDARWAYDPCYFFEQVYGSKPRWYQRQVLLCTSRNLTARQCRQSGKTLAFVFKILHYVMTNGGKEILILTPQEKQIKKIFDEYIHRDAVGKSPIIKKALVRSSQKPYYLCEFDNMSTIKLMVANEGARGQTGSWIYIDEAAIINTDMLNSILLTVASAGEEATVLMTSTPKGRGNVFYKACQEDPEFNEYHVSIHDIKEMSSQADRFRRMLGETGFIQECEAEFPDISGGPFNLRGISLAKSKYLYQDTVKELGWIYFGGVDWNGPSVGTYLYIVAFNPETYQVKVVDKVVVASALWNQMAAKDAIIKLNRKWKPKHWMCDYGYGHDTVESLRDYSMRLAPGSGATGADNEIVECDRQLKYTIETVQFGAWLDFKDPFTREEIKKTTKAFIIAEVAKLFEVHNERVKIQYSAEDNDLTTSLENYKLLNITSKGVEQYGFDKKDGIEDHNIDAFMLALYGIIKYYNELFKRIVYASSILTVKEILSPVTDEYEKVLNKSSVVLLTDNSPEPIELDDAKLRKFDPSLSDNKLPMISRTLSRGGLKPQQNSTSGLLSRRSPIIKRTFN